MDPSLPAQNTLLPHVSPQAASHRREPEKLLEEATLEGVNGREPCLFPCRLSCMGKITEPKAH